MQCNTIHGIVWSLLLSCFAAGIWASEADELRERAAAMRKEAAILAERGNKEEADRLEQEVQKARQQVEEGVHKAQRGGGVKEAHDVEALRAEIERLRAEVRELRQKPDKP